MVGQIIPESLPIQNAALRYYGADGQQVSGASVSS
jgi:hypothetical protein